MNMLSVRIGVVMGAGHSHHSELVKIHLSEVALWDLCPVVEWETRT